MNNRNKHTFGIPYKPVLVDREIPRRDSVTLKENLVEVAYVNGVKTTCHFMKYAHSTIEAAVKKDNGDEYWYCHGILHRDGDGCAVIQSGDKFWYKMGLLHRDDGPAIVRANGDVEYYRNNERYYV